MYGDNWVAKAPIALLDRLHDFPEAAGQEVVVLAKVLAAGVNTGYQDFGNVQVTY